MRISVAVRDLVTRVENRSNKPAAAYLAVLRKSGGAGCATAKGGSQEGGGDRKQTLLEGQSLAQKVHDSD